LPGEYFDLGSIGGHRVLAVPTKMGALAAGGSARQAVLFQAITQARALIAVGMAFGISSSLQQFGEVLVSRRVFPYDVREVRDDGPRYVSDHGKTTSLKAHGGLVTMFERGEQARAVPVSDLVRHTPVRRRTHLERAVS
jgi:nucleoside phosphorylase